VPVGSLQLFAMTSVPTGWLRADGAAISRILYPDLFASIGTTYGSGDGSTTFNVPNITSSGAGSPLYYIKAIFSGDVQPSTIAHATSHSAGGSDVISIKQSQINDFVFATEAARDASITSPTEGMRAYITSPTIPAATSAGYTAVPTGIQTIYNGSVWVCVTEVAAGRFGPTGYNTNSTSYVTTLTGDSTPISVTLSTGTSALVCLSASMYASTGINPWTSISVSGATTLSASDDRGIVIDQPAGGQQGSVASTYVLTGLTAGTNTFTMNYRIAGASNNTLVRRSLVVKGVA
jgi:hypothetical protein